MRRLRSQRLPRETMFNDPQVGSKQFSGTVRMLSQIVGSVLLLECCLIPLARDCSGACCSIERDIGRIWVSFETP